MNSPPQQQSFSPIVPRDPFPSLALNSNLGFKQFILRIRDHVSRNRRDLTHLRLQLLYENSDELIAQYDHFQSQQAQKLRQQQQQPGQQQGQQPGQMLQQGQPGQQQPPGQQQQQSIDMQNNQFLHNLHSRGVPRQSHVSEKLPAILSKFQSITSDFQYIHTLLSAPANTQSSEASSKQMSLIQTMLTHIITPSQRPFIFDTLFAIQTPLSRLQLQELHSQYISSAFLPPDEAMSGLSGAMDVEHPFNALNNFNGPNANPNTAGAAYPSGIVETDEKVKRRTERLEKIQVPDDVYESLASQTAADVSKVLDDFNKCVGTVLKELRSEQKHFTVKDFELIYNDVILRYAFYNIYVHADNAKDNAIATQIIQQRQILAQQQEARAAQQNQFQKNAFEAQLAMMNDGNGLRGVD